MNCPDIEAKIADFVAGHLGADERAVVETHLAQCPSCREFCESVRAIYAMPIDELPPIEPTTPVIRFVDSRSSTLKRAAAAVLLLFFGLAIGYLAGRSRPQEIAGETTREFLPPPAVALAMPRIPAGYPEMKWYRDSEEAVFLSRFTGRAVLTQFTFPECPRCQAMDPWFEDQKTLTRLSRFILLRVAFEAEVPPELAVQSTPASPFLSMPAVTIALGTVTIGPKFEISSPNEVESMVTTWEMSNGSRRPPIPRRLFEECIEILSETPYLLRRYEYATALREIDSVIAFGESYTTEFASVAFGVRETIEDALRAQIEDILRKKDIASERDRAMAHARFLSDRLADSEIGIPLRNLLAGK